MKYGLRLVLIGFVAAIFAGGFLSISRAQKIFSHATPKHREGKYKNCNVCHTVPTGNWISARADKEDPFPDVRNYPFNEPHSIGKHTACIGCHASDFYKPNFCLGCHTVAGLRANARNVRAFPNKSTRSQFITIFPHDAHQDIIAANEGRKDIAIGHFVFAFYSNVPDGKNPDFYNCSVCHKTADSIPSFAVRTPVTDQIPPTAQKDTFVPGSECFKIAGCFKDVPQNHATCFACHYQRIKPISTDCAGCHKLVDKRSLEPFIVKRYSLKFNHEAVDKDGKPAHALDCMKCHLRTAGSSDLQALKNRSEPEVPYSTCAGCHNGNLKDDIEKQKNIKGFQCGYCHTTAIGRYPKPDSHGEQ
jgi:hypothetical protein